MKERLYLLYGSIPEYVIINKDGKKEKIVYNSFDEFRENINILIKLCNDCDVFIFLDPLKCKNISFNTIYGFYKQIGLNRLNDYGDIGFYKINNSATEHFYELDGDKLVFDDILGNYIKNKKNIDIINDSDEERLMNNIKDKLLGIDANKKVVNYVSRYFLTDEKLKDIGKSRYNCSENLKSIVYTIYKENNNENDIKQIIRELLLEDEMFKKLEKFKNNYLKLAYFLYENYTNKLSFKQLEEIINDKFDYQMILCYDYLINYGFYIKDFDFINKEVIIGVEY